jgi:hypothetical protein
MSKVTDAARDVLRRRLADARTRVKIHAHYARYWLAKSGRRSTHVCANRWESVSRCSAYEVTLTVRDTAKPDGYSRKELYSMLRTVREHEAKQGWRVPEPT